MVNFTYKIQFCIISNVGGFVREREIFYNILYIYIIYIFRIYPILPIVFYKGTVLHIIYN